MSTKRINGRNTVGTVFGIVMILIYIGMGVLCFINFFGFSGGWEWLRWVAGVAFVLYGFWRAYRQVKFVRYYDDDNGIE